MAVNKISKISRDKIISKSVQPLPNNPGKAGMKADDVKKAMFAFVTDEKESVVEEINRIVEETNESINNIGNSNQEINKSIESINNNIKQINDKVSNKVEKEEGKGLSTNDFSTQEKNKLAGLNNYDDSDVKAGINEINSKIPAQASSSNKLADKDFVNSSIETATATFKGTFENLDLLKATLADKNDYAYYDHISNSNRVFDRYKHNGTEWVYEYTLNNSSFTDAQWKAINSGATAELINQILTNADSINSILNTLETIDADLQETKTKTTNAINTAESAYTKANNAFNEASNATTIGLQAKAEAVIAQNSANNAQQTANEALEKAELGASGNFLPLDGGTMSGSIKLTDGKAYVTNSNNSSMLGDAGTYMFVGNPTDPLQLRGKNTRPTYYNGSTNPEVALLTDAESKLPLTGGTLTGAINLNSGYPQIKTNQADLVVQTQGGQQYDFTNTEFRPTQNYVNTLSIGKSDRKFKDGYFSGNLYADTFQTDNEDWAQFQAYSVGGVYHAFEANDNIIRLDCRNFNGAGTDNRRILDLCCSRHKTNPVDGLSIWTAYTSLLKTGSIIKSGSKLNGTSYTSDTTLNSDLNITASSTLKTGSTVKANSIVNGNKYTADSVTSADITLTRNTGTSNKVITDAGGTINGTLTVANSIRRKNNSVEYNKAPSSTNKVYIGFTDKNTADYAVIDCQKDVSGTTKLIINPRSINGTWAGNKGTFVVSIDSSDNVETTTVTPANNKNDGNIATTKWVNNIFRKSPTILYDGGEPTSSTNLTSPTTNFNMILIVVRLTSGGVIVSQLIPSSAISLSVNSFYLCTNNSWFRIYLTSTAVSMSKGVGSGDSFSSLKIYGW